MIELRKNDMAALDAGKPQTGTISNSNLLPQSGTAGAAVNRMSSTMLFAGTAEVEIEHYGEIYRLRRTSKGKLILTK